MAEKKNTKSLLDKLSTGDVEAITHHAEKRNNVPLIQAKQVNMRLSPEILAQARKLAQAQGRPVTTFLANLLREDIERLWSVYKKAG